MPAIYTILAFMLNKMPRIGLCLIRLFGRQIWKRRSDSAATTPIISEIVPRMMFRFGKFALLLGIFLGHLAGAMAGNEPSGYAELEPALINAPLPVKLTEADLKAMPLDDPRLRAAYAMLIDSSGGPLRVDARRPYMVAFLNDLKRRGGNATPLLLDIMEKNHNTSLEELTPLFVGMVGSFKMEPYIDYIRRAMQTRPMEINWSACETFTTLFIAFGTEDDVKRMQRLAIRRPILADAVKRAIKTQKRKPPAKRPLSSKVRQSSRE